jgi:hypothetical protein
LAFTFSFACEALDAITCVCITLEFGPVIHLTLYLFSAIARSLSCVALGYQSMGNRPKQKTRSEAGLLEQVAAGKILNVAK